MFAEGNVHVRFINAPARLLKYSRKQGLTSTVVIDGLFLAWPRADEASCSAQGAFHRCLPEGWGHQTTNHSSPAVNGC